MSRIRHSIAKAWLAAARAGLRPFSVATRASLLEQLNAAETPELVRQTPHGPIRFHCPGALPAWRAETLLEKEPDTIAWLDSLPADAVLWDVGSNVGVFTLYAARRGCRVVSFEPCINNYEILCRNLAINGLEERTQAFCLALSDKTGSGVLNLPFLRPGAALVQFGERMNAVDVLGKPSAVVFRQMCLGYAADEFLRVFAPPFPTAMKIDVDGLEHAIIAGAAGLLADQRLRTLLLELDMADRQATGTTLERIRDAGFALTEPPAQELEAARLAGTIRNLIFWKP